MSLLTITHLLSCLPEQPTLRLSILSRLLILLPHSHYLFNPAVTQFMENRVGEIVSLVPGRVKPMTYQIYTCRFLACRSALIGYGEGWLTYGQDNVTKQDVGSFCCQHDFPVKQQCNVAMSVHCHNSASILIGP